MSEEKFVLITGSTGYVGTVLAPMIAEHYPVRTLDNQTFGNAIRGVENIESVQGDIRDPAVVKEALWGITDVVHLAGVVTDALVDKGPEYSHAVNVDATAQLLDLARKADVARFIYASSSSVYGSTSDPATEDMPTAPMTLYAQQKLAAEQLVLGADMTLRGPGGNSRLRTIAVRSATCCGPAPRMRLDTIVNVFSKQAYFDGVINVHDGTQVRSNIHVKDAAEFYLMLVQRERYFGKGGQPYNITGENHTALEIANIVQGVARAYMGKAVDIFVDRNVKDERQYRMSYAKAHDAFGWEPKRSVASAVRANFDFFKSLPTVDFNADIFDNTRRMQAIVQGG